MCWLELKVEDKMMVREERDRLETEDLTESLLETGMREKVGWRAGTRSRERAELLMERQLCMWHGLQNWPAWYQEDP